MDSPDIFPSPKRRRGNSMTALKNSSKLKPVVIAFLLSLGLFSLLSSRPSAPSLVRFRSKWRHHEPKITTNTTADIDQLYPNYNSPIHSYPEQPQSLSQQQTTQQSPQHVNVTDSDSSSAPADEPKWLLAVHTSANDQLQRNLIRSTWMELYPSSKYEFKFVLGNYTNDWDSVIEAEIATHNDIWIMPDFMERDDHSLANHVKNWELMKLLVRWEKEGQIRKYEYVSKVDHDLFLNLPRFYEEFMEPRLEGRLNNTRTLIGTMCAYLGWIPHEYACGRFYTMSWDLVELYADLFTKYPIPDTFEDVVNGLILYRHKEVFHPVWIDLDRMGDLRDSQLENNDPGIVRNDTIIVHDLKGADKFLAVASLFDENGFNGRNLDYYTDPDPYRVDKKKEEERLEALLTISQADGVPPEDPLADGELPFHELRLIQCIELNENEPKCPAYDAENDALNGIFPEPDEADEPMEEAVAEQIPESEEPIEEEVAEENSGSDEANDPAIEESDAGEKEADNPDVSDPATKEKEEEIKRSISRRRRNRR